MLHTGNLNNQVKQSSKTFNDLNEQIASSIKDPGIRVETSTQNFNGQIYHVIQGIRIKEEVNEDNSIVVPCSRPNLTPGFSCSYIQIMVYILIRLHVIIFMQTRLNML